MTGTGYLGAADWMVIVLYLGGIIAFGMWLGRGQQDTKDYFLGNRSISWWGVGLSIVATETSALTFLGVPAMAYGGDLAFIQIVIGYVVARVLLAIFLVPHYFRGEIYSPYQLIYNVFGRGAQRTAGGIFLVAGTLAAGVRVYVTCIPIQLILGFGEGGILWAILLFVGLSLIYTYVGGVKAVIWTEAVQFFLFVGGGLFTLFFVPTLIEGGMGAAFEMAREGGKLHWFNGEFNLGAPPLTIWMGVIGATFLVMSTHGADQLIVQRVLTCRSVRDGRKALALSAVVILPLFLMFLLTGVLLWAYYTQFPNIPIPIPEARPGVKKDDYIFPIFILTQVPWGLKGLLIVAILAAAMSSVSAALAALASVSTMDFAKDLLFKGRSENFYFRLSKASTLVWAAVLVLVAYWTKQAVSVLQLALTLTGITSGAVLAGVYLAVFKKGTTPVAVIGGMVASVLVMAFLYANYRQQIAWPWFTLIGTTVALSVAGLTHLAVRARTRATTG